LGKGVIHYGMANERAQGQLKKLIEDFEEDEHEF
jgi:hypothetical protein